jgi:tetratricopeptide (TPR) repeat protein
MRTHVARLSGVLLLIAGVPVASRQQAAPNLAEVTAVVKQAFRAAYSLDEKDALLLARRSVAMAPDEPSTHRALASILWLDILYKRGAVITDTYVGGSLKEQIALPKPPPELDGEFKRELARAIELAESRVRRNPNDVQARYDAGTAYALQASYTATVEGSVMTGMRLAKRAYDNQEFVLDHDPKRAEAGLVVGVYRYLVSTLSLPARFMAYLVGFGGGKEKGIALIEAAAGAVDTHVDARAALMLIYKREGRGPDALRVARELEAEFPRNRLFTLEAGSAATQAGRVAEADATLSRGLAAFDKDDRPKLPGERSVWLYKRGVARVALRHLADAQADLDAAMRAQPPDWLKGPAQIELGKIADLQARRADAMNAYRQAQAICHLRNDNSCGDEASRLLNRPYR